MNGIPFLIGVCCLFACANDSTNVNVLDEKPQTSSFPDSTNLKTGLDSILFAQACIDEGREDIAERYYWTMINRRDIRIQCRGFVDDAYISLAYIERDKEIPDTNLIFEFLDSANSACPKGDAAWSRANMLFDFGMDSVEYYLNIAYSQNYYIQDLSGFINWNIAKLDTTKLEFDWEH